jgi:uncharacterized protein YlxW (UPF0749 family)
MSRGTHERPKRAAAWRVATPVAVMLSGLIFAVSAEQSDGTDLRGGRLTDLKSVVRAERDQTNELTARVTELNKEVDRLSAEIGDRSVKRIQTRIDRLVDPAGLTPQSGTALRVTLTDAPEEVRRAYEGNPNDMVVHQQDIQAVANAMWQGGATAVTIQGQRLISTTGIKCEGNTVTLEGVPYAPPYVLVGIGPVDDMLVSLDADTAVSAYRSDAAEPGGGVGWQLEQLDHATAPGYEGLLDLAWARPLKS